jgi:hypothetical protein
VVWSVGGLLVGCLLGWSVGCRSVSSVAGRLNGRLVG